MYDYYLIRSNKDGKLKFVAASALSCCLPCCVVGYSSFASPLSIVQQVDIIGVLSHSVDDNNTGNNHVDE